MEAVTECSRAGAEIAFCPVGCVRSPDFGNRRDLRPVTGFRGGPGAGYDGASKAALRPVVASSMDLPGNVLEVSIQDQRLRHWRDGALLAEYPVSTARNGPGEIMGSGCTPRGWHQVRARIGAGAPLNTVFVRRRPTGEVYSEALAREFPGRDWILTRILWLSGLEPGRNRLGDVDSFRRFIYIHGTPDGVPMGVPGSRGCVRMRNRDLREVFEVASPGTRVLVRG